MTGPVTTKTVTFNLLDSSSAKPEPPNDKTSQVTAGHFQALQTETKRSTEKPKKPKKPSKVDLKSILAKVKEIDDPRTLDENSFNGLHRASLSGQAGMVSAILGSYPDLLETTTKEGYTPLHCVAIGGSLDTYVALVKAGANCRAKDVGGRTVLHLAAAYDHSFLVQLISVNSKELIESQDSLGFTPILMAALQGKGEVFQVLQNVGANVNALCTYKRNVLHKVLEGAHKNISFVTHLLKTRRDLLESLDLEGLTPLLMAAWCTEREVYELVLKAGANDKAVTFAGRHVLHLAMKEGALSTVEFLIETRKELINTRDKLGYTPLLAGAETGSKKAYEKLVQAGGDPKAVTFSDRNVLHVSAMEENIELLAHLLETRKKELLESRDYAGLTPLLVAASHGRKAAYKMLKQAGADDKAIDNLGRNVLHCASFNGQDELIQELLISNKELIDSVDKNGNTPLIHGVLGEQVESCKRLLQAGASFKASNQAGKTALKLAQEMKLTKVVELLVSWQAARQESDVKLHDSTNQASGVSDPQLPENYRLFKPEHLDKLLKGQIDPKDIAEYHEKGLSVFSELPNQLKILLNNLINLKSLENSITVVPNHLVLVPSHVLPHKHQDIGNLGINELHRSARDGQVDRLRTLISSHPDLLHSKSSDGKTALHWSVFAESTDASVRLLDAGSDPLAKDNEGYTILHLAVLVGNANLVIFLLETRKELFEIVDNQGNTPLLLAAGEGRGDMVNRLVVAGANLDARNAKGRNALHIALYRKHKSLAQSLIKLRKQLLEVKDNDGCTPLMVTPQAHIEKIDCSNTTPGFKETKEKKETKGS